MDALYIIYGDIYIYIYHLRCACLLWQDLQDNVSKLLEEFATAKQKKDDLQQQFEAAESNRTLWLCRSLTLCCTMTVRRFVRSAWSQLRS